jgi:Zinc finger, C2H2 type
MFSLVTALVSPCVIESVAHKKEVLIAALQENAGVICSHPADSVCLLQGDWDNVKKAYAIIEEFYLRTQAESVVRRMLKNEPATDAVQTDFVTAAPRGLVCGRIPPDQVLSLLLSPPPTDEGESAASKLVGHRSPPDSSKSSNSDMLVALARQCRALTATSNVNGILPHFDGTNGEIASKVGAVNRDDSPPVLSREENIDDISTSSDASEPQDIDLYASGLSVVTGPDVVASTSSTSGASGVLRDCSGKPDGSGQVVSELNGSELQYTKDTGHSAMSASPQHRQHTSSVSTDHDGRPFSNQLHHRETPQPPQQHFNNSACESRLPQFSSVFSTNVNGGASGTLSSWPYAEFYSAHLSAMRSICEATVKRESSIDASEFTVSRNSVSYQQDDDPLASELRCSRCGKTYRSEARMREHARTHDAGYVAVLHTCPKCGKAFTYRHNMVVHLRRFHYGWQPAKRHACRTCGMRFQKPYLLRLHERKAHMAGPVDSGQFPITPTHSAHYAVRE